MPSSNEQLPVDVKVRLESFLREEPDLSTAIAAIKTLTEVLEKSEAGTLQELIAILKASKDRMKTTVDCSSTSVVSGCELFVRFITLAANDALEASDFEQVKRIMLNRGKYFTQKLLQTRPKIVKLGAPFLKDNSTVLVHGRSRVVLETLKEVKNSNKRVFVYVTEAGGSGNIMKKEMEKLQFDTALITDTAVGAIMARVDCVMVGSEGVVESGGIVNTIGTYTIALCAQALNKPFYVMCESFKFVRLYPLNQDDLPDEFKFFASTIAKTDKNQLQYETPRVDYTPPNLITLLFTDLGILTPSAVSDELIKLYL